MGTFSKRFYFKSKSILCFNNFKTAEIGENGVNLPDLLTGIRGIYTIVTNSQWASGHCDLLFEDATCIGKCHFSDPEIIYYCDVWDLH